MVEERFHPPPAPSTPREAPWREIEQLIDGQKAVIERINALIEAITAIVIPPPPGDGPPIEVSVLLKDLITTNMALDMRSFLIMLYRLGRAREVRIFDYSAIDGVGTASFTYTVPAEFVYVPHIEDIELGIQRVITRREYEGGNPVGDPELNATDRIVEWTMTPLARVFSGSFGISFENTGLTDTWIKSRFLGTLMRESDFLTWRQLVRDIGGKYMAYTA